MRFEDRRDRKQELQRHERILHWKVFCVYKCHMHVFSSTKILIRASASEKMGVKYSVWVNLIERFGCF